MKKIVIEALERPKKKGKFREEGFVPGVLYGEGMEKTTSVKFNAAVIRNLIAKHGSNAKIWVDLNGSKKFGVVKAIEIDPLSNKYLHLDVQIIAKDQKMKLQVPISFIGEDLLKKEQLELRVSKHEVTLIGDMTVMPEVIEVDLSTLKPGDQITYEDFKLDKELETDDLEIIYAVVNHIKVVAEEEETETVEETAEPAKTE